MKQYNHLGYIITITALWCSATVGAKYIQASTMASVMRFIDAELAAQPLLQIAI